MTRLTGEALHEWARQRAYEHIQGTESNSLPALEFLLTETYLQGAIGALKEEVDFLRERGPGERRQS